MIWLRGIDTGISKFSDSDPGEVVKVARIFWAGQDVHMAEARPRADNHVPLFVKGLKGLVRIYLMSRLHNLLRGVNT